MYNPSHKLQALTTLLTLARVGGQDSLTLHTCLASQPFIFYYLLALCLMSETEQPPMVQCQTALETLKDNFHK
jgi:hypothetical protein